MESTAPMYELDASQIARALNMLEKEQQQNLPTERDKFFYRLLNYCLSVFGIAFVAMLGTSKEGLISENLWNVILWITILSAALALVFFVFYAVPLVSKTWRQWRLVRRLGLSQFTARRWRQRERTSKLLTIGKGVGISIVLLMGGLLAIELWKDEDISIWMRVFIIAVYVVLVSVTSGFIRRRKARLEALSNVGRLMESFKSYQSHAVGSEALKIEVPPQDVEGIFRIERSRIARQRREAISGLQTSTQKDFATLKSGDLKQALANLDGADRLAVEVEIENITQDAEIRASSVNSPDDSLTADVPNSALKIIYSVDVENRRVKVLTVVGSDVVINEPGD
jgi:hypothetical protein